MTSDSGDFAVFSRYLTSFDLWIPQFTRATDRAGAVLRPAVASAGGLAESRADSGRAEARAIPHGHDAAPGDRRLAPRSESPASSPSQGPRKTERGGLFIHVIVIGAWSRYFN